MSTTARQLPAGTHIANVRLRVTSLSRSLAFYEGVLGLQPGVSEGALTPLTVAGGSRPIIYLLQDQQAASPTGRRAGLFHVALRVPSRTDLGSVLRRIIAVGYHMGGAADHLVSEALYLSDPEGNGIEIYVDRPKSEWSWERGEVAMATDPLDVRSILELAGPAGTGLPPGTDIGHIHLQIGDLKRGEDFYSGSLGFNVTQRSYPGALFLSAGGYHHHLGLNIWGGRGIPPQPENAPGLDSFVISVPDGPVFRALAGQVTANHGARTTVFRLRDADGIHVDIEGPSS